MRNSVLAVLRLLFVNSTTGGGQSMKAEGHYLRAFRTISGISGDLQGQYIYLFICHVNIMRTIVRTIAWTISTSEKFVGKS